MRGPNGMRVRSKRGGLRRQAQHQPWSGGLSWFCTGASCRRPTQVKRVVTRIEAARLEKGGCPLEFWHREVKCLNGHDSTQVYVMNGRNERRFGKVGSY